MDCLFVCQLIHTVSRLVLRTLMSKISTSQAAIAELLENIIKNKNLPLKEKRKKLKQFQNEYP